MIRTALLSNWSATDQQLAIAGLSEGKILGRNGLFEYRRGWSLPAAWRWHCPPLSAGLQALPPSSGQLLVLFPHL